MAKRKASKPVKRSRSKARAKRLPHHPLADAFPMMAPEERAATRAGMKRDGFRRDRPVVLFEGAILDGRNRYEIAIDLKLKPVFRQFNPKREGSPRDFVVAENINRRHLSTSQRALAMAQLETVGHGGKRRGDPVDATTRADLAKAGKVSVRTLASAGVVRDQGSADLQAAVRAGAVKVSTAAQLAEGLAKGDQDRLVAIAKRDKLGERAILDAARVIRQEKSEARRAERNARIITNSDCTAESMLAGGRRYPLIYADPPVKYIMGDSDRSVENRYRTMTLQELCALPIAKLAAPDCVLLMWLPEGHLFKTGYPILQAWGFEHQGGMIWDKVMLGMGHYVRLQHEHLLICTRGAVPQPLPANRPRSIYSEKRSREHSEKPKHYYRLIEKMYPQFFRKRGDPLAIELFARDARPGWARWGNQAPPASTKVAA